MNTFGKWSINCYDVIINRRTNIPTKAGADPGICERGPVPSLLFLSSPFCLLPSSLLSLSEVGSLKSARKPGERAVSSPSWVLGGAPAENKCGAL